MKPDDKRHLAAHIIDGVSDERRDAFNAAVLMTIKSTKTAFPDLDDKTLGKLCECIARIVSGFNSLPVGELNNALQSMFQAYVVASASLEGLIDIGETPENIHQIIDEVINEMNEDDVATDDKPAPYTGFYL